MRYHEILITFMRAARVPPSGVDFSNTLKEFTLLEETGNPDVFFGKRKMHPYFIQKYAHATGCLFHRKANTPRYE